VISSTFDFLPHSRCSKIFIGPKDLVIPFHWPAEADFRWFVVQNRLPAATKDGGAEGSAINAAAAEVEGGSATKGGFGGEANNDGVGVEVASVQDSVLLMKVQGN
jgi:hypothetical protein